MTALRFDRWLKSQHGATEAELDRDIEAALGKAKP